MIGISKKTILGKIMLQAANYILDTVTTVIVRTKIREGLNTASIGI